MKRSASRLFFSPMTLADGPKIPTLVGSSKCMNARCQVCDLLDTQKILQIPGTSSSIQPENNNCDSYNIVYLLICEICDSGNYIGETSNKLRFRLNNHKKSIRDSSRGFLVAVNFNHLDHSLENLRCYTLRRVQNDGRQTHLLTNVNT